MKILALGDVVGERTLPYLRENLGAARRNLSADLVIANGENVCDIHGLSPACASALFDSGVDLITGGNHILTGGTSHPSWRMTGGSSAPPTIPPNVPAWAPEWSLRPTATACWR